MKKAVSFLLRMLGAVGVALVFYAMLAGPILLLGGPSKPIDVLPRQASR